MFKVTDYAALTLLAKIKFSRKFRNLQYLNFKSVLQFAEANYFIQQLPNFFPLKLIPTPSLSKFMSIRSREHHRSVGNVLDS